MYNIQMSEPLDGPVLLTGAAGLVGSLLAGSLEQIVPVRRCDVREVAGVVGDLADPEVADRAVDGVAAIVHLAAYPRPDAPWEVLARANLQTTANLLDAAARHGVRRVVLAGSVHAAGGYPPGDWPVDPAWPARPCCAYGVSKAGAEDLLRLFADQQREASAVALRLGLVAARPRWTQEVRGWTPETDVPGLVAAALRARAGYQVHFAVTAAPEPRYRTDGLRSELGFRSEAADHLAGPLGDQPPAYFENCGLWRALVSPDSYT
jgi:nucleoside-diphosphate-sugar epimerase